MLIILLKNVFAVIMRTSQRRPVFTLLYQLSSKTMTWCFFFHLNDPIIKVQAITSRYLNRSYWSFENRDALWYCFGDTTKKSLLGNIKIDFLR